MCAAPIPMHSLLVERVLQHAGLCESQKVRLEAKSHPAVWSVRMSRSAKSASKCVLRLWPGWSRKPLNRGAPAEGGRLCCRCAGSFVVLVLLEGQLGLGMKMLKTRDTLTPRASRPEPRARSGLRRRGMAPKRCPHDALRRSRILRPGVCKPEPGSGHCDVAPRWQTLQVASRIQIRVIFGEEAGDRSLRTWGPSFRPVDRGLIPEVSWVRLGVCLGGLLREFNVHRARCPGMDDRGALRPQMEASDLDHAFCISSRGG